MDILSTYDKKNVEKKYLLLNLSPYLLRVQIFKIN